MLWQGGFFFWPRYKPGKKNITNCVKVAHVMAECYGEKSSLPSKNVDVLAEKVKEIQLSFLSIYCFHILPFLFHTSPSLSHSCYTFPLSLIVLLFSLFSAFEDAVLHIFS